MANLGLFLKDLLREKSLSMRKLSKLTDIDPATISRIVSGKRNATPEHLRKIAQCLEIPIVELFQAAGYPVEKKSDSDDLYSSLDSIQKILESTNLLDHPFSTEQVESELEKYRQFAATAEGEETILKNFGDKLGKLGSIGPFISRLKDMFDTFTSKKATAHQLAIMGSALLYFIVPVDVIPDYIFPIGYLDDAIAVHLVSVILSK